MNKLWREILIGVAAVIVAGCTTPTLENPYPGNGGSQFKDPTASDIADAQLRFDETKLSAFQPGVTTKREITAVLGKPTWWTTHDNGNSQIGYDFLLQGSTVNVPEIAPATFVFDSGNVLVDLDYAGSYKKFHVERGPVTYAYVEATVGESFFLGGIVPSAWAQETKKGEESVYLGGYVRSPIQVEHVIAGDTPRRHHVVEFTVAAQHIPGWKGYFLLGTDKFGTTRVVTWDTKAQCELKDDGPPDGGLDAVIKTVRASSLCVH
jgi:hypothetical protein